VTRKGSPTWNLNQSRKANNDTRKNHPRHFGKAKGRTRQATPSGFPLKNLLCPHNNRNPLFLYIKMKTRTQYDFWNLCLKVNKRDIATRRTGSTRRHMEYLALQDRLRIKAAKILKAKGMLLFQ
jgi:hypothetical protein